ncbi:hypothetical protein B0H19DRAFT_1253419 [Mycena capillaripes]|nr:hypothetical protein B0H19DRAFT_1253419 [Mycena capillaripes]
MLPILLLVVLFSSLPSFSPAVATPILVSYDPLADAASTRLKLRPQQPYFAFDLTAALPPAHSTLSQSYDEPPSPCTDYTPATECSTGMTAQSVYFEDCGDPFTVCRCADATMSMDTIPDRLARVPVGLRRYMGVLVVLADTSPHAYTLTNGDIHLFGDCAMDTWIHEMMHAYDFAGRTFLSDSSSWAAALAGDTCVPDNYSLTNQGEACFGVIKTYMLLYDGQLPTGFTADCMSNQLKFMVIGLPLFNPYRLFGNNCDFIDGGLLHGAHA